MCTSVPVYLFHNTSRLQRGVIFENLFQSGHGYPSLFNIGRQLGFQILFLREGLVLRHLLLVLRGPTLVVRVVFAVPPKLKSE